MQAHPRKPMRPPAKSLPYRLRQLLAKILRQIPLELMRQIMWQTLR
jgi:hypothetical protein